MSRFVTFAAFPASRFERSRLLVSKTCSTRMSGQVLVTGATGFIGSHLVPMLVSSGYTVHTISRREPEAKTPGVYHHIADVTDSAAIQRIASSCDWFAVLHLAGLISYTSADAKAMEEVNVTATAVLLKHVITHSPAARFVLCSTVAAVGSNKSPDEAPLTEDAAWDKTAENVGYLRTKRKAEEIVRAAAKDGQLKATVLCPSNVYGAGDASKSSRKTQVKAANGKWPLYTRGGVNVLHVRVLVEMFKKILEVQANDPIWRGERWLVVGENISIQEMLSTCAEYGGNKRYAPWLCLPVWVLWMVCAVGQIMGSTSFTLDRFAVATRYHWFNGAKARDRFLLESVSAREALKDSVDWMRTKGMVSQR